MCSIFGAVGRNDINEQLLSIIRDRARDRGRDGGQMQRYALSGGGMAILGNWRATPTPEVEVAPLQPYDGVVHNGTIANDKELGARDGEVDSMVLPRILDRRNIHAFLSSLRRIRGSYALAAYTGKTVLAATNYKPLYYARLGDTTYFSSMERHLALPVTPPGFRPARMEPYSVMDLMTFEALPLPRRDRKKALVICSAGLDSTTAAYKLANDGYEVALLHFRYGCKAETREVALVSEIGQHLNAHVYLLDIDYAPFKGGSPLLTGKEIAAGVEGAEYAHEWVPARNLLMIAHAVAFAEANGFSYVALGNNLEEAGAYPDNEEEFTSLLDMALDYAVSDGAKVRLIAPLGGLMKHEIVALGVSLGVPYELTWSCYRGGNVHCGRCGPCLMRKTAFDRHGFADPAFAHEGAPA